MDLERLNLRETAQLSKLIELLGTPAAADEMESCIRVCEGAATMYRKELEAVRMMQRNHE